MYMLNFYAAWIGILLGFVAGAVLGLFFHREDWLDGYHSWRRRMIRLGHISFFGIAFINMSYAFSGAVFHVAPSSPYASCLFVVGAVTMPLLCFLAAYREAFRHFFFIPVLSLVIGTLLFFSQWTGI